ncbi:MAG: hypothetical protein V7K55_07890 [Nostoc sp.]|uniref:hypothetical protein n=1 Tax=Nostoc sp. TaxID=1180 RepID=UPI002FFC4725
MMYFVLLGNAIYNSASIPPLESGDRLTRHEIDRRYTVVEDTDGLKRLLSNKNLKKYLRSLGTITKL